MGIKMLNGNKIKEMIQQYGTEKVETLIFERLNRVGLNFIRNARSKEADDSWHEDASSIMQAFKTAGGGTFDLANAGSFHDQTAQLRNSIGYVVARNGVVLKSDFSTDAVSGTNASEGKTEGENFANELIQGIRGFILVCVAGANYASYVEDKGYDVITGSELKAREELKKMFG